MQRYFLLFLGLILCSALFSQNPRAYNVVGGNYGLDVSVEPPLVYSTAMVTKEASASISDSLGNLLFYTNGGTSPGNPSIFGGVWNANHQLMENGELGEESGCISSFQGTVIVPFPKSDAKTSNEGKYYIIMQDCLESVFVNGTYHSGLTYAVVDMNFNNGLGKVISKGNVIDPHVSAGETTTYEQLQVTQHANGNDFWLFFINNNHVRRLLITASGFGPIDELDYRLGRLDIAPSNDKMLIDNLLYDFNPTDGSLTLRDSISWYSGEFSGNGRYYYKKEYDNYYQYDLEATDVYNSKTYIATTSINYSMYLAANGVIYLYYEPGIQQNNHHISGQIRCSNSAGFACDFTLNSIDLNGNFVRHSMSNMIASDLYYPFETCTIGLEETLTPSISISPNPTENVLSISSEEQLKTIEVYSMEGKILLQTSVNALSVEVRLNSFSSGTYLLKVYTENGKESIEKIVKH